MGRDPSRSRPNSDDPDHARAHLSLQLVDSGHSEYRAVCADDLPAARLGLLYKKDPLDLHSIS